MSILSFVFLQLLIGQTTQQTLPYQFQHLSESDGLASNLVHCGLLDSRGYMWFGTHTGLSRWDGLEFKNFHPNSTDSLSTGPVLITSLLEDSNGHIWIASHNSPLYRFIPALQKFEAYPYPLLKGNNTINAAMKLYQDKEKTIWIGTFDEGFLKFNPTTGQYKQFNLQDTLSSTESKFTHNSVIDILEDIADSNILWLAANNGLYQFNKITEQLTHFPSAHPKTSRTGVQSLMMNEPDHLWLGTYGAGLVKFSKKNNTWEYNLPDIVNWNELNFRHNVISAIAAKSKKELWITSKDKGAGIFNIATKRFSFFQHDGITQNSIISNIGYKLYTDKEQRVWFFMAEKGLSFIDPNFQNFTFHTIVSPAHKKVTFAIKDFLFNEKTKKLLVLGQAIDGLFALDLKANIKQVIQLQGHEGTYQIYNDLLQTSNGQIWVAGGHSKGKLNVDLVARPSLLQLNEQANLLLPYTSFGVEHFQLQKENIIELIELSPNELWGITGSGKLFQLWINSGQVKIFELPKKDFPVQKSFQTIVKQKDKSTFFIGTNHGLVNFDTKTEEFSFFANTSSFNIRSLQEKEDKLWIGTAQLKCIDLSTKHLEPVNNYNNAPIVPIDKVFVDATNRLWTSTQKGLFYLDSASKNFVHFGIKNGLSKEFFFYNGTYQLPDSSILLGQENGFFSFKPNKLLSDIQSKRLVFTNIKINGQEKVVPISNTEIPHLSLSHKENTIDLSFSPLAFSNQENVPLLYRLEGIDEDWVFPKKNNNAAMYNKLPPGNYRFQVKNLLKTKQPPIELGFTINPPFYKTIWAYLGYFLLTIFLLLWLNQFLLKKRFIEHEAKRLKELNQFKSRLYTNITHEFRTPLTVISGMANQIEHPETKRLIKKNTQNLLNLVNQMLDLSKIEAGKMKPNYTQADVVLYLKYLVAAYQSFAATQNKTLSFSTEIDSLLMDYDPIYLKRIISNLLSNALKFTNEFGKIQINLRKKSSSLIAQQEEKQLLISVIDDGIGIPKNQQKKIFDRFYQVDNTNTRPGEGTGIGLSLVKELTLLLNGNVSVNSEVGKGTTFHIRLPITNEAAKYSKPIADATKEEPVLMIAVKQITPQLAKNNSKTRPSLLIIEDQLDVVEYMQSILSKDYQIEIAQNGKVGIDKALETVPDIIISDIMMPEMDGFQVCEYLKSAEKTSHIPILLLTAKASQSDKLKGLKQGADAYLTKPFDQEELLTRLKHIINKQQKIQSFYSQHQSLPKDIPIENEFIQKVRSIIAANYQEEQFALSQLCEQLFLSRTQVFRKVKALTNSSPSDMILHYRLEQGKNLLIKQQELSVTEIAFQVGFRTQAHFSAAYKKHFGLSPTAQRKTKA